MVRALSWTSGMNRLQSLNGSSSTLWTASGFSIEDDPSPTAQVSEDYAQEHEEISALDRIRSSLESSSQSEQNLNMLTAMGLKLVFETLLKHHTVFIAGNMKSVRGTFFSVRRKKAWQQAFLDFLDCQRLHTSPFGASRDAININ